MNYELGIKNYELLALYGTNSLTDEHIKAIKQLTELQDIILFFDGDQAGKKAVKKYANELKNIVNCKLFTVNCPENEDINSLLDGHEPDIFKHLLDNRQLFFSTEKIEKGEAKRNPQKSVQSVSSAFYLNTNNPDYITLKNSDLKITILGGINLQQLYRLRITIKITAKSQQLTAKASATT